jgi:transcriptional regulator GlxA family with amidase domain
MARELARPPVRRQTGSMAEEALAGPNLTPAASPATRRLVVVVMDGASLGIMSFAFGVFDAAVYYGALPELDVRIVSGEPDAAIRGGGLVYDVPYDLSVIREADLVIVPFWRDPAEHPPEPLLESLRGAHAAGARVAGLCSGVFVLAAAGLLDERPATTHWALAGVLAEMYPKICVRASVLYIDDGYISPPVVVPPGWTWACI